MYIDSIHMYICINKERNIFYIHIHIYIYIYIYISKQMDTYIYIYVFSYINIQMHYIRTNTVYTYMYTHTHTDADTSRVQQKGLTGFYALLTSLALHGSLPFELALVFCGGLCAQPGR